MPERRVLLGLAVAFLAGAAMGGLAVVLSMPPNAAPQPPAESADPDEVPPPEPGWLQFHPAWRQGGVVTWRGTNVTAPDDVRWATDGETYLYASRSDGSGPEAGADCQASAPAVNGTWVLVHAAGCGWARHPAVSCSGTTFCAELLGRAPPGGGGTLRPPTPPGE